MLPFPFIPSQRKTGAAKAQGYKGTSMPFRDQDLTCMIHERQPTEFMPTSKHIGPTSTQQLLNFGEVFCQYTVRTQ